MDERTLKDSHKEQLIEKIRHYLDGQPIERAWLFGPFARGEANPDSDIDLLVQFDHREKIDLFDYIGIQQDLEDLTGRKVDLVEAGQARDHVKPNIDRDKELIYEKTI